MEFFDTHCHLADKAFHGDLDNILRRAWEAGVAGALCVGYDLRSSRDAIRVAERDSRLWAAVGVHPHYAAQVGKGLMPDLAELARHPKVVAIGETGLDFYRDLSPRPAQRDVFQRHIDLAQRLGLPLIVHDRDAHDEILKMLQSAYESNSSNGADPPGPPETFREPAGVMHCFSGDAAMAGACLHLGFYIAFAGPVSFPTADRARAAATVVPADRLLVETDCPYLAPQAYRGRRNEPAWVAEVTAAVARARGESVEVTAAATTTNARRLFLWEGDMTQRRK